ncbi:MAG TPA: hypothetical protein VM253_01340 [Candidatus Limnocylindrales bacterium]|nr:hypothetical protein [Candidatus Limnocylindrales bacterium]
MTIGAIDPEQRRVAERLILASLRRFHREQPLSVDLRIDALVARVRAAAARRPPSRHRGSTPLTLDDADLRRVIDDLVADGRLVRRGRRIGLADASPGLDPEMDDRVRRLLEGLRSAGAEPPRVDGLAARLGIPPATIDQLRSAGVLRHIGPGIDYPSDVWSALHARVTSMRGERSVARVRDELRTSRRHAEAILAALSATR